MELNQIIKTLVQLRKINGFTLERTAKRCNFSLTTMNRYESGIAKQMNYLSWCLQAYGYKFELTNKKDKEINLNTFGVFLKIQRINNKFSLTAASNYIGISPTPLQKYENGHHAQLNKFMRWCRIYGLYLTVNKI